MAEALTKNKKIIGREIEIGRRIGAGTYGEVYMAKRLRPEGHFVYPETFVVKIMRKEVCTPEYVETIHRELLTIQRLTHPFIVDYIGSWVETSRLSKYAGCYCLATHHCNGGDLHSLLYSYMTRRQRVPEELVVQLMVQVFAALNFVHAHKVIHRDIKPANIFLVKTLTGVVEKAVVGDFGLARPLDQTCQLVDTRIGTPSYISPEIVSGDAYTYKTDMFSAGATFFEVMALEKAFWKKDYTEKDTFRAINSHNPVPRLSEKCNGIYDKNLIRIVAACLAKQEKHRPTAFDVLCSFSVKITRYVREKNVLVYNGTSDTPVRVTTPKERASPIEEARRSPSPAVVVRKDGARTPKPEPAAAVVVPAKGDDAAVTNAAQLAALLMAHCPSDEDAALLDLLGADNEMFVLVKAITITRRQKLQSMENAVFKLLFALKPTAQIQKTVELLSQKFGSSPFEG